MVVDHRIVHFKILLYVHQNAGPITAPQNFLMGINAAALYGESFVNYIIVNLKQSLEVPKLFPPNSHQTLNIAPPCDTTPIAIEAP